MSSYLQMGPDMGDDPDDITQSIPETVGAGATDRSVVDSELRSDDAFAMPALDQFIDSPHGKIVIMIVGIWLFVGLIDMMRG